MRQTFKPSKKRVATAACEKTGTKLMKYVSSYISVYEML
jgi:hypothetical protein